MAFTKAQLEALKNALLASGQPITAAGEHRPMIQALIEELFSAQSRGNLLAGVQGDSAVVSGDTALIIREGEAYLVPLDSLIANNSGRIRTEPFDYSGSQVFELNESPLDVIGVTLNGQTIASDGLAWTLDGSTLTVLYDLQADDYIQVCYSTKPLNLVGIGSAEASSIFDQRLALQKDQDGGIAANDTSILSLDVVTDLSTQNRINRTRAYVNGGGQGGSTFTYIPSGSGFVADGGVYFNAADGGLWKRDYEILDPIWFGVENDGVIDDTTNLIASINASKLAGKKIGIKGKYFVSSVIDLSNVDVEGNAEFISNTADYVIKIEGSLSTYYNLLVDRVNGQSSLTVSPADSVSLNLAKGDLVKIISNKEFAPLSGEGVSQGEIQRVKSVNTSTGVISIYGYLEDSYLVSDSVRIAKITPPKNKKIDLKITQGGNTSSNGLFVRFADGLNIEVEVNNAINVALSVYDCYNVNVKVNNYGANRTGIGYGILIGNSTMFSTFSGVSQGNRHAVMFGGSPSFGGVSWGCTVKDFSGSDGEDDGVSSGIFNTHASCGRARFENCQAIGGIERNNTPYTSIGFTIEGRNNEIINCFVKNCAIGIRTTSSFEIDLLKIDGLVSKNVFELIIINLSTINNLIVTNVFQDFISTTNGSLLTCISSIISSWKLENLYAKNSGRIASITTGNTLPVLTLNNCKSHYDTPPTNSSVSTFVRNYQDGLSVILKNCESNAPHIIYLTTGLALINKVGVYNCTFTGGISHYLYLRSEVQNIEIVSTSFENSSASAFVCFCEQNINSFKMISSKMVGTAIRGLFLSSGKTINNLLEIGNEYENASGLYFSTGIVPSRWVVAGSIGDPRILKGTGTPESVVTAKIGVQYINLSGGAGTTLYVKESGTGNTGWVAK
jgi:hypothetical protein